jgi:hypothetical protein
MTDEKKSRLELLSDMIETGLADETVKFFVGKKFCARHEQTRRAVWTRSQQESRVEINPRNAGGQKFGADEKPSKQNAVVTSLTETREVQGLTRVESAELHLYAEDEKDLDDLWDEFLAVFRKNPAVITFRENQGITYVIQELDSETQRQPKLTALVYFKIPVATETKKLVKIVSVVQTHSLDV